MKKPSQIDGLVHKGLNSSVLAMELHLSCTGPLKDGCVSHESHENYNAMELHLSCTGPTKREYMYIT